MPGAAAYDPSKDHNRKVHALYFPTEQQTFTYQDTPSGFPESRVIGKAADYELVACTTGIPQKKKSECAFIGGKVLELHDGEIEVRVVEAKTAKLVETRRFKASSSGCPSTYKFWGQRDRVLTKIEPAAVKYFSELEGS